MTQTAPILTLGAALALAAAARHESVQGPASEPAAQPWYLPTVEATLRDKRVPGVVVGLIEEGRVASITALGLRDVERELPVTEDTLFQVGSLTKPMTATLLGLLVERGVVSWEDPVGAHLPPEVEVAAGVREITLEQLATHTSGLPREPVNRRDVPGSPSVMEPYSIEELYAGLAETRLEAEPGARWSYSNLGYGLLGHLLELATERDFDELLRAELLEPCAMADSGIRLPDERAARVAVHYWPEDEARVPRPAWVFGEVVAAAGVTSSAGDLCRFALAHLSGEAPWAGLAPSLRQPRVETGQPLGRWMSRAWFVDEAPGLGPILGHGGEVDGHGACVAIVPRLGTGVVVLCNTGGDAAESVVRALMPELLRRAAAGGRAKEAGAPRRE